MFVESISRPRVAPQRGAMFVEITPSQGFARGAMFVEHARQGFAPQQRAIFVEARPPRVRTPAGCNVCRPYAKTACNELNLALESATDLLILPESLTKVQPMANTFTQIYIQVVFAVEWRQALISRDNREELH